jgi:MFS family permease
MHHGKVYYFSIILFVLYLIWRTHYSSVYVYERGKYNDTLEGWVLFWFSIGYLIGSNLITHIFQKFNYKYKKCFILLAIIILFASFLFWVDSDHYPSKSIHQLTWRTIFLEYSIYIGSLIYGIGISGIMSL